MAPAGCGWDGQRTLIARITTSQSPKILGYHIKAHSLLASPGKVLNLASVKMCAMPHDWSSVASNDLYISCSLRGGALQ